MNEKKARYRVADALRATRAKLDLSIEFVANNANINKDTISRYENGLVSQQIDILENILKVYKIDFAYFFTQIYANKQNGVSDLIQELDNHKEK